MGVGSRIFLWGNILWLIRVCKQDFSHQILFKNVYFLNQEAIGTRNWQCMLKCYHIYFEKSVTKCLEVAAPFLMHTTALFNNSRLTNIYTQSEVSSFSWGLNYGRDENPGISLDLPIAPTAKGGYKHTISLRCTLGSFLPLWSLCWIPALNPALRY